VYKENNTPTQQEDDCSHHVLDAIDVMSTRLPCLATKMQNYDRDLKEGIRIRRKLLHSRKKKCDEKDPAVIAIQKENNDSIDIRI
jgi:hypothetical protein